MNDNKYSFNAMSNQETTVDFLPFFLIGILGKVLPFNLTSLAVFFSMLGGWLCSLVSFLILRQWRIQTFFQIFGAFAISLLPCVNMSSGSGFMASLFAANILFIFYFFLKGGSKNRISYTLMAILPLVRIEGILFAFIYFTICILRGVFRYKSRVLRASWIRYFAINGLLVATPFILLSIWRYYFFGYIFPAPIPYKEATGDLIYLKLGAKQLFQIIDGFKLPIFLLFFGYQIFIFCKKNQSRVQSAFLISLTLFSLVYFISGGDWFPIHWSRYLLPFLVLFFLFLIGSLSNFSSPKILWSLITICLTIVVLHKGYTNIYRDALTDFTKQINRWERIDRLAALGFFLEKTTEKNTVLASSEVATIMYHAHRDALGLLGFANPEAGRTPRNPFLSSPLVARKRYPELIEKYKPDMILFYEPINTVGYDREINVVIDVLKANHFRPSHTDISYYMTGSYQYLIDQGYTALIVLADQYVMVYWVHQKTYDSHIQKLLAMGAHKVHELPIDFTVTEGVAKRFGDGKSP